MARSTSKTGPDRSYLPRIRTQTLSRPSFSELLGEHGCLTPANYLQSGKTILVGHEEVFFRMTQNVFSRVRLESKENFEKCRGDGRTTGNVKQMSSRRDHSCNLAQPLVQRNIFQSATSDYEIKRIVGEGKRQEISFSKGHVPGAAWAFFDGLAGGGNRGCREIEGCDAHREVDCSEKCQRK